MATEINRNVSIDVNTDPVVISEERNPETNFRKVISIINTSTAAQVISIAFTDEAGAGNGIPLSVGGFYIESQDAGFSVTNSRITAVSSAAGGTVAVMERLVRR